MTQTPSDRRLETHPLTLFFPQQYYCGPVDVGCLIPSRSFDRWSVVSSLLPLFVFIFEKSLDTQSLPVFTRPSSTTSRNKVLDARRHQKYSRKTSKGRDPKSVPFHLSKTMIGTTRRLLPGERRFG